MALPILYSLQNCPYAMRARLAILLAQQPVMLRAIDLKNKPAEMLTLSPKGTVPVLVLENRVGVNNDNEGQGAFVQRSQVIEESLDIMLWALTINDPENLLYSHTPDCLNEMLAIIEENDTQFKPTLEQYKRAKRYHNEDEEQYRQLCEPFVQQLESRLTQHAFLMGAKPSLLDYALLPFIRQFSRVNRQLYLQGPYSHLHAWLNRQLQSRLFSKAMFKYPLWLETRQDYILGE
jgi:glutathione S-transferase|tara:strand:- start:279 stop:980 length:702 start_codon:yes stop_codon:yes gene_type:complete